MKEKEQILPEQLKNTIEYGYKYLFGFNKEVPENMTLKELVELTVAKYRDDDSLAMNIYSICVAALVSSEYARRLIINGNGIDCQVNINGKSVYL